MFENIKRTNSVKILAFTFVLVMLFTTFGQNNAYDVQAAPFSFVGEDSNVTSEIKVNGKSTGVQYTRIHLGAGGSSGYGANRIINIVEADLKNNSKLTFEVINNGTYIKDSNTVPNEVAKYREDDKKILAAVNGDWMISAEGLKENCYYRVPFSPLVIDSEIWCSQRANPEPAADYYTMCITKDNKVLIDKPTVSVKVKNDTKSKTTATTGLNRAPVDNSLNVYNNRLGTSNYVTTDAYEVVIKTATSNKFYHNQPISGTVTKIYPAGTVSRSGLDDNTIILTARGSYVSKLSERFSIGDKVTLTATINCSNNKYDWANCEEAIGGQCLVMKNGSINNDLSGATTGQYPTNIIGYKKDGTVMMTMVTADTNDRYEGLNFKTQIAKFCKEIGYDTCFLFDGGGSTTMVTLDENGRYVERACYSDGDIRYVWNTFALVYDETPDELTAPATPTAKPTKTPTKAPTSAPAKTPTKAPTKSPTKSPTVKPTKSPTKSPSAVPTQTPVNSATVEPTKEPAQSAVPTENQTDIPTNQPATVPTEQPSDNSNGGKYEEKRQCSVRSGWQWDAFVCRCHLGIRLFISGSGRGNIGRLVCQCFAILFRWAGSHSRYSLL